VTDQPDWKLRLEQIWGSIKGPEQWKIGLVLALMAVNWGLEALKWKLSVAPVQQVSFWRAFKAVMAGVSLAVNTPNRIGEYVGRVFYIEEGKRLQVISLTVVGSLSQLVVTLVMGCIGLFFVKSNLVHATEPLQSGSMFWLGVMQYITFGITLVITILYFRLSWLVKIVEKLPGISKYAWFFSVVEQFGYKILLKLLSLSTLRYIVFVIQYILLFQVFKVELNNWLAFWLVSVMFLALAIIPTIAIAEIGIRGKTANELIGMFSSNILAIDLVIVAIWLINLAIPALIGVLLILRLKIFKNKE
jgi:Lysylphosphatidylglycerol synthase TM region